MEIVMLVIVIAIIAWWLGFARSARKVANMATTEIDYLAVAHKGSVVKRASEIKITESQVVKATENLALLGELDLFNLPTVAEQPQKAQEVQNNG